LWFLLSHLLTYREAKRHRSRGRDYDVGNAGNNDMQSIHYGGAVDEIVCSLRMTWPPGIQTAWFGPQSRRSEFH